MKWNEENELLTYLSWAQTLSEEEHDVIPCLIFEIQYGAQNNNNKYLQQSSHPGVGGPSVYVLLLLAGE